MLIILGFKNCWKCEMTVSIPTQKDWNLSHTPCRASAGRFVVCDRSNELAKEAP